MSLSAFEFTSRARPIVEIGLGDTATDLGVGRWDVAHWDDPLDATWAGTDPYWLDVTCDAVEAEAAYGRQRSTDVFAPGTATITLDNSSGRYDLSNPGTEPSLLGLRAGRAVRVSVEHTVYGRLVLWRGYVDAALPDYDPEIGDVVVLEATCALGDVGRVEVGELAAEVGAGELGSARFARILDAAGWSQRRRVSEPTGVPTIATKLGEQVADLLSTLAESVGGAIYGDREGRVSFRGRDWQTYDGDLPVDGAIGNVDAADVCPSGWTMSNRRDDIVTRVVLARETDEAATEWNDPAGQAVYGVETYEASDLVCSATSQLDRLAQRLFRVRGWTVTPRVESVRLVGATSDAAVDLASTVDVFKPSRYRCRLAYSRGGVFDAEMLVTGVRWYLSPSTFDVDLDLDLASPWRATAGRWDEAMWDRALWGAVTVTREEIAA